MIGKRRAAKMEGGFTLIEIIVALIILGVLATGGTYAVLTGVEAYTFARDNDAVAQKAQNALNRLVTDLALLDPAGTSGSSTSLTYRGAYAPYPQTGAAVTQTHTVTQSGETVSIDGNALIDNVKTGGLRFTYYTAYNQAPAGTFSAANTKMIGISLTVLAAGGVEKIFTARVALNKAS